MSAARPAAARPLILFAIPELDAGGPDRVVSELLHGLDRGAMRLALTVQRGGGRYFDGLPDDVECHVMDVPGRYPWRALAGLVDKVRPDLVFTTLRMNLTAPIARLVQRHKAPIIARQANAVAADFAVLKGQSLVKHRVAEHVVRWGLRRAEGVVAQSHDMAAELRRELRPSQLLETIGNPVDVAAVTALAAAQRASAAPLAGDPAIVSVGRLMAQKGYDRLIAGWPIVIARHPRAHLTVFGEGPDRGALEAQIAALGVGGSVTLAGRSETALASVAAASLFVSSSRYEGFSNALLEAMALGVPVVATDCPGATREMVVDGETGTLVQDKSGKEIADGILAALEPDRAALGAHGRAHVAARFGQAAIMRQYEGMMARLLQR